MAVVSAGRPQSANNPIDLLEEFVSANDWRFDRTTDLPPGLSLTNTSS